MATSTRSSKLKKRTSTGDKSPAGNTGKETGNTLIVSQINKEFEDIRKNLKLETKGNYKIIHEVGETLKQLAEITVEQNTKVQNMESYLAKFDQLFNLFQRSIEESIGKRTAALESRLEKHEKMMTEISQKLEIADRGTAHNKTCSCSSEQKPDKPDHMKFAESVKNAAKIIESKNAEEIQTTEALKLKRRMSVEWSECMNDRKKSFWHFILNRRKRLLYTKWSEETPQFLPRKFRPKFPNNKPEIAKIRLREAHQKYHNNIQEMKIYEESHLEKFKSYDDRIMCRIDMFEIEPEVKNKLQDLWFTDTTNQEQHSLSIWTKKERFLSKKKHEELASGTFEWDSEIRHEPISSPCT